jgi:hypothetical protein
VSPAEVRGKVRVFKRQTAERGARLDAALADETGTSAIAVAVRREAAAARSSTCAGGSIR